MGNCSSSSDVDVVDEEIIQEVIDEDDSRDIDVVEEEIIQEVIDEDDWPAILANAGEYLNLWGRGIGDEGAVSLAEALKANTSLKELNLIDNKIGDEGAVSLAEALKTNTSLQKLNLSENKFGDKGAASLAEALKTNTSLRKLALWGNKIGDKGAASLAEALKTNTSLQELNLREDKIGDKGAISLAEALKDNTSLQELNLGVNDIGDEGFASLAEALKWNNSLQKLNLRHNDIGDEGFASLAEAIKWNTSLRQLNLNYDYGTGETKIKMVEDALSGHRKNPPKLSLAAANSVGLLTLPQLAPAGYYVAFVDLLRSDASGMDSVPAKDVVQLLLIAVHHKGSAEAAFLLEHFGGRIDEDKVPTEKIIEVLRLYVEHEDAAGAVALLKLCGERVGRDKGTEVTEAQAASTTNAVTGLSESILKPHAGLLAYLHSDEMLPHWAAKSMEPVIIAMEEHLYPALDRASIAACKAAAKAVGPGTPGLEAAGQIVAAGNADAKGGGSSVEVYDVTWNSKVSHDPFFNDFMERSTKLKDDTDASNPGKVRNPGVSYTSMMVCLYRVNAMFLSELERIRESVGQGVTLQFGGNKSVSLKGATRTLEKAIIKTIPEDHSATTIKFDSVLDGVRAMFVHEGCEVGIRVLNELHDSEVMVNARIKNRTAGTIDGWRDVLGNWFVTPEGGDKPVPVEVQVVERMMLVQREQLGGHHDYGNIRSSRGLLQLAVGLGFLTKDQMDVATKSDCAMGDKLETPSSSDIAEEVAQLKEEVEHFKVENAQFKDEKEQLRDEIIKLKDEVEKLKDENAKLKVKGNQGPT